MLNAESIKYNLFVIRNVKNTTLNDRLKQARIKKMKLPKPNKKGKNEKSDFKKYIYSKDYLDKNCRNIGEIKKKCKNQSPDEISLVSGNLSQHEAPISPKSRSQKCLSEVDKSIEEKANETVIVSKDFIEDVQKYKKKIRTPKDSWELKYEAYVKDDSSNPKTVSHKKEELSKQIDGTKTDDNKNQKKSFEKTLGIEAFPGGEENVEKENLSKQLKNQEKCQTEVEPEKNFQLVQPFLNKLTADDMAKTDKSYIQSLLTVAKYKGKDKKKDTKSKKSKENIANEEKIEKKTKISGQDFFNRKIKKKKTEAEDERKKPIPELKKASESPDRGDATSDKETAALLVRDFAKSEELQKESSFDYKKKPKTVILTHSKPAVAVTARRKRKLRQNLFKKTDEEFIETSFPGENLRGADVREIWKRESDEKSEYSFSSHSSCTVPETDESPEWKNLGLDSYKTLKKLVEEEVKKISKQSENKDNVENKINDSSPKAALKIKTYLKTPFEGKNIESTKIPVPENFDSVKKKTELLRRFTEDIPEEPGRKLRSLKEKEVEAKIPSKIIEEWNILNRLEQAFVALGNPTFPATALKLPNATKVKKPSPQKNQKSESSAQKVQANHLEDGSKLPKKKESSAKKGKKNSVTRLVSSNHETVFVSKTEEKTLKKTTRQIHQQNKKIDINNKISVLRERLQGNVSKKQPERQTIQQNPLMKNGETNPKLKRIKLQDRSNSPKVPLKSLEATTATTMKKKANCLKPKLDQSRSHLLPAKVKIDKRYKKNGMKNSEEPLERQITFNGTSGKTGLIPLKSLNFTKTVEEKIQFLRMKNPNIHFLELDLKEEKLGETKTELKTETKREMKEEKEAKRKRKMESQKRTEMETEVKTEHETETEMKMGIEAEKKKETVEEIIVRPPYHPTEDTITLVGEKPESAEENAAVKLITIPNEKLGAIPDNLFSRKADDIKDTAVVELTQPEQLLEKTEPNNNEKVLKKRLILWIHSNTSPRLLQTIQEKNDTYSLSANDSNIEDLCKKTAQNDFGKLCEKSNTTISSSGTNYLSDVGKSAKNSLKDRKLELPWTLTKTSLSSCNLEEHQNYQDREESKATKNQTSWEQDTKFYRTIITDILSQYKRIKGFLKQTGCQNILVMENSLSATTSEDKKNQFYDPQMKNSLTEYRNKISIEYQALPIFEYKTKQRSQWEDAKKRNLAVTKDLKTDVDLDLKDYKMNVKPVLDLHLKQQESCSVQLKGNGKDKNASLQEILLSGKVKSEKEDKQLRSFSMPNTSLHLQTLSSTKKIPSKESVSNLTSLSMTNFYPETESESC